MAGETLLELADLLAAGGDNSQGLITPLDYRNMIVSEAYGVAFVVEEDPFTVPITDGVWTAMGPVLPSPDTANNIAFSVDGNNNIVNDYVSAGVTVNDPTFRLNRYEVTFLVMKTGGGTGNYQMRWSQGGNPLGNPSATVTIGTTEEPYTFSRSLLMNVADQTPVVVEIQGVGTNDDLDIQNYAVTVSGALL